MIDLIPTRVTSDMNSALLKPLEDWEIKKAVFWMGPHKAPGPDGLNRLFYQQNWEIISSDMIILAKTFFETASFPPNLNETLITLIPKVNEPEGVGQFRPISCCNFIFEVLSKIIVERMKDYMRILSHTHKVPLLKADRYKTIF